MKTKRRKQIVAAEVEIEVRVPVEIHRELQRRARRGNISLNQLVVALLVTA